MTVNTLGEGYFPRDNIKKYLTGCIFPHKTKHWKKKKHFICLFFFFSSLFSLSEYNKVVDNSPLLSASVSVLTQLSRKKLQAWRQTFSFYYLAAPIMTCIKRNLCHKCTYYLWTALQGYTASRITVRWKIVKITAILTPLAATTHWYLQPHSLPVNPTRAMLYHEIKPMESILARGFGMTGGGKCTRIYNINHVLC